jgi:hypothetical protein
MSNDPSPRKTIPWGIVIIVFVIAIVAAAIFFWNARRPALSQASAAVRLVVATERPSWLPAKLAAESVPV